MGFVHVRDKETGHEFPVSERLFDAEAQTKTGKPALDPHGELVPVKFRTTADQAATKKASAKRAAKSGQKAETEKE